MELVHLEIDTSSPFPNHDFDSFDHAATEEAKLNCTDSLDDLYLQDFKYCNTHWDRISCWPLTRANQFAIISCFAELSDVQYDTTQNATRFCFLNGTWAKSDYSRCTPILSNETESEFAKPEVLYTMHLINYFGYSISIIALLIALIIFAYFKDLHCIRNTIHANFMISHLFVGVTWIVTALVQRDESEVFRLECLLYIILIYFNVTTFFWMFIEGLYLYILVLKTFSIERVKKHTYLFIGWGLPVILVSAWTPLKYYFPHVLYIFTSPQKTKSNCPWSNNEAIVDHVFIVLPILFILLANIFFLGMVIYVLVTQLCISTAAEFQQYRKAAKALLVLTPLLGITYALILVAPESTPGVLVGYLHSILFSTQGLTVAVLYCFLNSEVRNSLRYHVMRWKAVRMLKTGHYPIPVPYSLKMRPRQTMRCNRLRYTFSANGNSCIVTGRSNDSKSSFQESVPHFPAVIRYSSKSTKSTSLSEDFV